MVRAVDNPFSGEETRMSDFDLATERLDAAMGEVAARQRDHGGSIEIQPYDPAVGKIEVRFLGSCTPCN